MKTSLYGLILCASINVSGVVYAHGDVAPQPVDTSELEQLGDEWETMNPYTDNEKAIEI